MLIFRYLRSVNSSIHKIKLKKEIAKSLIILKTQLPKQQSDIYTRMNDACIKSLVVVVLYPL